MSAVLIRWRPEIQDWPDSKMKVDLAALRRDDDVQRSWVISIDTAAQPGDDCYVLRASESSEGIVASGVIAFVEPASATSTRRITFRLNEIVDWTSSPPMPTDRLPDRLRDAVTANDSPLLSVALAPDVSKQLALAWQLYLAQLKSPPLPRTNSVEQVRRNFDSFVAALRSQDAELKFVHQHPLYFVWDPVTDMFAPAKWAAFSGMTRDRYLALKDIQRKDKKLKRGFSGGTAQQHLVDLFGAHFATNPELNRRLNEMFSQHLGVVDRNESDGSSRKFIALPQPNDRRFWWINQGARSQQEIDYGYLWEAFKGEETAPKSNPRTLSEVRTGDLVFTCADDQIRAVGVVSGDIREALRPSEIDEDSSHVRGRLVHIQFRKVSPPIPRDLAERKVPSIRGFDIDLINTSGISNRHQLFELPRTTAEELLNLIGGQTSVAVAQPQVRQQMQTPQNIILYGPPGTGKTHATAAWAVSLCDETPLSEVNPATAHARFRELLAEERIAFVTFHQSMSYEEFVEGIRPALGGADEGSVRYECRRGIFRRICDRATAATTRRSGSFRLGDRTVWKMSLGAQKDYDEVFRYCIDNDVVLLGYGGRIDFSGADTEEEIEKKMPKDSTSGAVQMVHALKNEVKIGDLVVVPDGNSYFSAIGEITGPWHFIEGARYHQARSVKWLLLADESISRDRITRKNFTMRSIYRLSDEHLLREDLENLIQAAGTNRAKDEASGAVSARQFVLVIDEINRGNISRILGELITLLEPDKRAGSPHALSVTLPYSQEDFSVPQNLHVIGTMNTADRSIALLDSALRRRFRFVAIAPDASVIQRLVGNNGNIDGIDVARLFSIVNRRIEAVLDGDHRLGHSYFLRVRSLDDLRNVFSEQILPLLFEYFYGEWAKISWIVGSDTKGDAASMIRSEPTVDSLPEQLNDGNEKPRRYAINDAFLNASGTALVPFFSKVITGSKGDPS